MELLKDSENCPELNDCGPSIKMCKKVKSLINAMNSRTYENHLKPGNEMWKVRLLIKISR